MPSQPFPFGRFNISCFAALTISLLCAAGAYVHGELTAAENPPRLEIKLLPDSKVELSWTNSATGFFVQQTPTAVVSNLWESVSQSPVLGGGQYSLVLSNQGSSRFFRLHGPASQLPPDPSVVAPPVSKTTATDMATATSFLYSGTDPIQTGVTNGTIEPRRVSVLRGKVIGRNGAALSGVRITVLGHPEFGQTLSRADGAFDLAVNGGGQLTVRYEKEGFLGAQRAIVAPWRDYAWLPDVVLVAFDTAVTAVDLTVAAMQVARGSTVSDEDGSRRATILFPQGTSAGLVMPNGTTQAVNSLNIRATEFTVGSNGPAAMPAALPPSSGYTYCVELSADEAVAAGAADVRFSQPLPVYVENFLNFPVGTAVPTGYYDRQKGQWIASQDGRVIKVLGITGGLADLDLDGNGATDDAAALGALGITDEERTRLGQLYATGQSLWRMPISHFTPWDGNWPYGPPADAVPPPGPAPNYPPIDNPSHECGSTIGVENQTLGESVAVTGTPWRLHYQSARTPGRKDGYTIEVRATGGSVPASLRRIRIQVAIAGHLYTAELAPAPNLTHRVIWNGKDSYGRQLVGTYPASVQVHYDYTPQYFGVGVGGFEKSFARAAAAGFAVSAARAASLVTLSKAWTEDVIGAWDARTLGFGGWTLGAQHAYDWGAHALVLGTGTQRRGHDIGAIITTVAGSGEDGFGGDGGPAVAARLFPTSLAFGGDGTLYIAAGGSRVRTVGVDGIIRTVAGNGGQGGRGDGGPATAASFWTIRGIAIAPDRSLFIADSPGQCIRRVNPAGIIDTLTGIGFGGPFGSGRRGFSGDGGPATAAMLDTPMDVDVGSDGSVFIADQGNNRIRCVGPDGIITTVAGSANAGFAGDGGPATAARLNYPRSVAVGPDGTLYIADQGNFRIRRVAPDGIITTLAGNGTSGYRGDGGLATAAQLNEVQELAVGPDGSVYIADHGPSDRGFVDRIRRVGPDGIINTVVGGIGQYGFSGDGGPATAATVRTLSGVALAPDGTLYLSDQQNWRVRQVRFALPDFSVSDLLLPSEDAQELYLFNAGGRHLKTLNALTGLVRYQFSYDADGYLESITDDSSNVTTVARSGAVPTALIAPGGQRTALAVSSDGWLLGVTNSVGEAHTMNYSADGLLRQFIDPLRNTNTFTYDPLGLLVKDEDPLGGSITLARTEQSEGYTVTVASAMGRTQSYQVEQFSNGAVRRIATDAAGAKTTKMMNPDGREETIYPDGETMTVQYGPDPRWGMLARVATNVTWTTPGGLTRVITTTRTATLSDPLNPFSLTQLREVFAENGAVSSGVYNPASRLLTITTAGGRTTAFNLDAEGRLTRAQFAGLKPTIYGYNNRGLLNSVIQGASTFARTNRFDFNAAGYVTNFTDPLDHSSAFKYDAAGRVITQIFPDGRTLNLAYDANGNLTSLIPPGRPAHTFEYSALDFMSRYNPPTVVPGTNFTLYTYDLDRQLAGVKQPALEAVQFAHSVSNCNCGRLASLTHVRGTNSYSYAPLTGQLTVITAPGGIDLAFNYDGSLLTAETLSGPVAGRVTNAYDSSFRPTSQSINNSAPISFQYDADSLLTRAGDLVITRSANNGLINGTALGQIVHTWTYNEFGEVTDATAAFNATPLYEGHFTRDQAGRIIEKTEAIAGVTDHYVYNFDLGDRLASVLKNGATIATYTYDSNDNRLSFTGSVVSPSGSYDLQDRLTQYGGTTYTYTDAGDLKTRERAGQITSYDYDALGNLVGVTLPNATQIEYLVDGVNRRVGKKISGLLVQGFLYDGPLRPVAELDASGNVVSRFVYGRRPHVPDYMIKVGVTYRIISDHLGSPRLVVDVNTGNIAQRIDYDEFGQVVSDTSPGFQPFGFAGGLYDTDTKLVRFGARDYDAETGRWTTKDPIGFDGGDANLYAYVLNDPINLVDPSGLSWLDWEDWDLSEAADFAAGVGDGISFGLTKKIRQATGADQFVNPCSGAYKVGDAVGVGVDLALGGKGLLKNLAKRGARKAAKKAPKKTPKTDDDIANDYVKHLERTTGQDPKLEHVRGAGEYQHSIKRFRNRR